MAALNTVSAVASFTFPPGGAMRWRDVRDQFLFGGVDGLNGAIGLIVGLTRSHAASVIIFTALLARAGSSAVSMGGAQLESDEVSPNRRVKWARVTAMASGYLCTALLPGAGFAVSSRAGLVFCVPVTAAILAGITWFRSGRSGWVRAGVTTVTIFILAVAAGLLASLAG